MSDLHSASALAGATIVLTRATGSAATLRTRVQARGGRVVCVPGLSLRAVVDAGPLRQRVQTAMNLAHAAIFNSPAAVRFAFRLLPALDGMLPARVFAVGAGTQRALARHRVRALAPGGRSDSEALLALPELADVRGRRIVLMGAAGGRDLLASTLTARGAQVESMHVYQREPPRLMQRHFDALAHAADPLLTLISSAAALTHLVALLPASLLARLRRQTLVVSSARLAAIARENGFAQICVAASALPDDLIDAAQKALTRHRL